MLGFGRAVAETVDGNLRNIFRAGNVSQTLLDSSSSCSLTLGDRRLRRRMNIIIVLKYAVVGTSGLTEFVVKLDLIERMSAVGNS